VTQSELLPFKPASYSSTMTSVIMGKKPQL